MPTFVTPRGSLSYEDHGGPGTPLVALHGFFMDRSMFDPQVSALHHKYRFITIDAPGHGGSSDGSPGFTYWDLADDVAELLDSLGIRSAIWMGHSQGGYIALRAAIAHPEKVAGLVLIATETGATDPETRSQYEALFNSWRDHEPDEGTVQALATQLLGQPQHWGKWPSKWLNETPYTRIAAAVECLLGRDDITDKAAKIRVPAIVIGGEKDQAITPPKVRALAQTLRTSNFTVVPGAAHAVNLTHPESVNRLIAISGN